ncbi:MAG: BON domain-containing protein [Rudaea sp.]
MSSLLPRGADRTSATAPRRPAARWTFLRARAGRLALFATVLLVCLLAGCMTGNGKAGCDAGCVQDRQITAAIETAMRERASLPDWEVQVQTEGGIVYLHGLVDTIVQKDAIEAIARETPGVVGVENAINLRASSR